MAIIKLPFAKRERDAESICAANGCEFFSEDAFRKILRLEKRRSERSKKPFFLALIAIDRHSDSEKKTGIFNKIAYMLATKTRDIDVKGWYRNRQAVGLILPEVNGIGLEQIKSKIAEKVGRELLPDEMAETTISVHVFPGKQAREDAREAAIDPAFFPEIEIARKGRRAALAIKRLIDLVGAAAGIMISFPLLLIVPIAIKLDSPGPVFFRQKRVGRGGRTFSFLKFRSMRLNNDPSIHRKFVTQLIQGRNPNGDTGNPGVYKIQDDPRVTRVGKFIRKTSLDELPQFFNVFAGDMSLVGPRPPIPYEVENYELWHQRRVTDVKPGITGLWQVEGRSSTAFADMVRLDLRYISDWSLWLDIKIMLLTPKSVIAGKGAV